MSAVPDLLEGVDSLTASLAYGTAGLYVGPLRQGSKHPGSVLGAGWPGKTFRDPQTAAAWFAGADHGVFLHCGRSGLVVLDVDHPEQVPDEWWPHLDAAPFQSTRAGDPRRGHYLFAVPPGRTIGNSVGSSRRGWGEVRGTNGVIVVAPTRHEKAAEGGRYLWQRGGEVPALPPLIARTLPEGAATAETAATDDAVRAFLDAHRDGTKPWLAEEPLKRFAREAASGSRHDACVSAACWIVREAAAGLYPAQATLQQLRDAFLALLGADRDGRAEFAGIVAWAVGQLTERAVQDVRGKHPQRAVTGSPDLDGTDGDPTAADDVQAVQEAAGWFWKARPELEHVRDFALARRASPWAVLGVVLARVVTAVPPFVVLPPLVGTFASLNLFAALVGPSGGGKGSAEGVAADCLDADPIDSFGVGSGEGLTRLFVHRQKMAKDEGGGYALVQDRTAVLLTVPEVDNLAALGGRQGATLLPQLRQAWIGEDLGFAYSDPEKALKVRRGTYRLTMVLGVQPGRAAALLDDADGGTPQRFIWLPVLDPDAPDEAPVCPKPLPWTPPAPWRADGHGRFVLPVPDATRALVDSARLARLRGQADALDGHALLARLKVAAALGMFARRQAVTDEDWTLAGAVMEMSDRTRSGVVDHLAASRKARNLAAGQADGERAAAADDVKHEKQLQRVCRVIRKALGPTWATARDARRTVAGRDRPVADEALDRLVRSGSVEVDDTEPDRPRYRAVTR